MARTALSAFAIAGGAEAAGVVGDGTPESCTGSAFANALVGGGLVTFDCGLAPKTIVIDTGLITNGTTTTVDGGGTVRLDGDSQRQLFFVLAGGDLTVRNISLTNGNTGAGGALHNAGTARLENVNLSFNEAVGLGGGAIYNTGELHVTDSTFFGNAATAGGGAILTAGEGAQIDRCLFRLNAAEDGGAILVEDGFVGIRNTTFSANIATDGGGLRTNGGVVQLFNATFDRNQADHGGALFVASDGTAARNSVFARSLDRAGVSEELECDDAGNALVSFGGNLASDGSCELAGESDQNSIDPVLDEIADNGGPTFTILPLPGSPLIDGGPLLGCPDVDQRGFPRPVDGDGDLEAGCDIGAVEVPEPAAAWLAALVALAALSRGTRRASQFRDTLLAAGLGVVVATPASAGFQILCAVGTASPSGFRPCTACAPGTFASGAGATQCQTCAPGTYADEPGSAVCVRDEVEWPASPVFPFFPCDFADDLERCILGGIRDGGIVHVVEELLPAQDVVIEGKSFTLRAADGVTPVFDGSSSLAALSGEDEVRVEIEGLTFQRARIRAVQTGSSRFEVAIRDNWIVEVAPNGGHAIEISAFTIPSPGPVEFEITGNRIVVELAPEVAAGAIGIDPSSGSHRVGVIRDNVIEQTGGDQEAVIGVRNSEGALAIDVIGNHIAGSGFNEGISVRQFGDGDTSARIANNAVSGQIDEAGTPGAILASVTQGSGDFTIVNNTVAFNESGLIVADGEEPSGFVAAEIANNIVAFNTTGMQLDGSEIANVSNLVFGNGSDSFTPGPGTLAADPMFSAFEGLVLQPQSPARNAGSNAHVPADLITDLAGDPRIFGPSVDIGAYELQVPEPATGLGVAALAALAAVGRRRGCSVFRSPSA